MKLISYIKNIKNIKNWSKRTLIICASALGTTVFAVVLTVVLAVSCSSGNKAVDDRVYTITFETSGGTEVLPISSVGGCMIFAPSAPKKPNHSFVGWHLKSDFSDDAAEIPNLMPYNNVTYYAKFIPEGTGYTVTYDYNLGKTAHTGKVENDTVESGKTLTIADGAAYKPAASDYKFLAWSTSASGVVSVTEKLAGQYNAGEQITPDGNIKLYAQWARGYTDSKQNSADIVYVNFPLVERGKGAAILVRNGEDKYGFVASGTNTESGYDEFTFYFEQSEGGDIDGRLYHDYFTYEYMDSSVGIYLQYDYVYGDLGTYILALDGYGFATVTEVVGQQTATRLSGSYVYTDKNDYEFSFTVQDADTTDTLYFAIEKCKVGETDFDGYFRVQGYESGSFLLRYGDEILYQCRLYLNGYGTAKLYKYDPTSMTITHTYEGTYEGTADYQDYSGEWLFTPSADSDTDGFAFILSEANGGASQSVSVYIMRDSQIYGTYTNGADTLYMDGYGVASYTAGDMVYIGVCELDASNTDPNTDTLIFYQYELNSTTGKYDLVGIMYFTLDRTAATFTVNTSGFTINESTHTLTAYIGTSAIVEIPSGVTTISENAFNYKNHPKGVSVVQVTIPASVASIGNLAFENKNTLKRVIFLSETPIAIDFSDDKDPFRWPSGDFIIVVPESKVADYKKAWPYYKDAIKGSEEVLLLPEYEISGSTLIRYNKQPNTAEKLDLIIPDGVTAIADGVFKGLDFVQSVNLNNVTTVGASAFEMCENLVAVKFTKVTAIGASAFAGCNKLAKSDMSSSDAVLELPAIVNIGASAFADCFALRVVKLGATVTNIGGFAFFECNVYTNDPPLMVELLGEDLPAMAAKVFVGNIAFRIKVKNIAVAKKFYASAGHAAYCTALYIESGAEKGKYMDGANTLVLDGRAVLNGTSVMLYEISDTAIKFYEYDKTDGTYAEIVGTYQNDIISFAYDRYSYAFKKVDGKVTFRSKDGKYTLECDPSVLDPENYQNYKGTSTVKFNGVSAQLYINGYNTKIIQNFTDSDGKRYDFKLTVGAGNTFTYVKSATEHYIRNITSADGSSITLHFTSSAIYVFGEIKGEIGTSDSGEKMTVLPATSSDYMYRVTQVSDTVYVFERQVKNDTYRVTLTLSSDMTTFTYAFEKI